MKFVIDQAPVIKLREALLFLQIIWNFANHAGCNRWWLRTAEIIYTI